MVPRFKLTWLGSTDPHVAVKICGAYIYIYIMYVYVFVNNRILLITYMLHVISYNFSNLKIENRLFGFYYKGHIFFNISKYTILCDIALPKHVDKTILN